MSFLAASEAQVREVWALAIEMGGTNEGKPGFREYASDFYAAYCRDPEGISFVLHMLRIPKRSLKL